MMTCHELENFLMDAQAGDAPDNRGVRVEQHLAGCAACRDLARQLKELDAQLQRQVKSHALSPTFQERLKHRLESETRMSAAEIAERKRQFQAEYERGLSQLSPFALPPSRMIIRLAWAAAIAGAGWVAWRSLPRWTDWLAASGLNPVGQIILPALIAGALFAGIGLIAAFPEKLGKLRETVLSS